MSIDRFSLPGLEGISQRTVLNRVRSKINPELNLPPALEAEVTEDLMAEVVAKFPSTCPSEGTALEDVYRKQGEQRVVRLLLRAYYEQNPEVK